MSICNPTCLIISLFAHLSGKSGLFITFSKNFILIHHPTFQTFSRLPCTLYKRHMLFHSYRMYLSASPTRSSVRAFSPCLIAVHCVSAESQNKHNLSWLDLNIVLNFKEFSFPFSSWEGIRESTPSDRPFS